MTTELNPAIFADIQTMLETVGEWFYAAGVVTGLSFAPIFYAGIRECIDFYRNRNVH